MKFPTLYKKTNTGAIQAWMIQVDDTVITTTFGQVDGKQQVLKEAIAEGKNVGRANETTPAEQAAAETKSKWEKQVKKGYVQDIEQARAGAVDEAFVAGGVAPMLSPNKLYGTDKNLDKKMKFPAFVQPKLDGSRCIAVVRADGDVTLWSRTRKPIKSMPHIVEALQELATKVDFRGAEELVLDGELYNHTIRAATEDAEGFQKLMSLTRKDAPDAEGEHKKVELHVYDVVERGMFIQRLERLREVTKHFAGPLVQVNTFVVSTPEGAEAYYRSFLNAKYEGAMLRNAEGKYEGGKRSAHLRKMKLFEDHEFLIVDVRNGRGKFKDCAIFVCLAPEAEGKAKDPTFDCTSPGNMAEKQAYLDAKYVGQWLTITHQGWTADGKPRCPIAKEVRPQDEAEASAAVPDQQ